MGLVNHSDARGPPVPAGSRIERDAYTGTRSAFGHAEKTEDKPTDDLRLRFSAATAGKASNIATASSGLETAAKLSQLAKLIKKCGVTHPTTYKFVETLYTAWKEQGRYSEAEPLLGHMLAFDKEVYGLGSDWTLYTEHEIAENIFLQGRLNEAEELAEVVLKKAKKAFGEWNAQTTMTESLLGLIYFAQGNYADAIHQQRRCWGVFQHALGPTAPETIWALRNLFIAMQKEGGHDEELDKVEMEIIEVSKNQAGKPAPGAVTAVTRLGRQRRAAAEKVLSKKKDEFGKEHAETIDAMADVAQIYYARGLLEEAVSMQTEILQLTMKVFGQKSFKTLEAINQLGHTRWAQGDFVKAETLRKQAVRKSADILGPKHPSTIEAMARLASAYASGGRFEEALAMEEQVLILRREVLQPWHGDTLTSLASLADRWSALGKYNDAVVARKEILQHTISEHNKKDHPEILDLEVLTAMELLAESLMACERYKEAEQIQRDAHHHLRRMYGVRHYAALNMWSTLADTLHYQGLFQQSVRNEMEVYEITKTDWGETHPKTIEAVAGIARGLGGIRRHREAVVLERYILDYRKECLGPAHLETTWAQENLAAALSHLGREEQQEAEVLRDEVLRFRMEELGEKNEHTLDALEKLASSWTQLGHLQEAEDSQVKVLHHRIEILGTQHPETIWALRHLSRILYIEGKWETATQNMSIVVRMLAKFLGAEHPKTIQAIREQARMPQERHDNLTPAQIMRRIDRNERFNTGTSGMPTPEEESNTDAPSTVQKILDQELERTKAAIALRMSPSPMTTAEYEYKVKLCGEDTRTIKRARKSMDGPIMDYAWDIDAELASTPQHVVLLRRQAINSATHNVKDLLQRLGRVQDGEEKEYAKFQDAKKEQNRQPRITIQIAVDKGDLETVLTPTIMSVQAAISSYQAVGGSANILITDDGMGSLPRDEAEARRQFYKANDIGWVARSKKMQHGGSAKARMASSWEHGLTISMMAEDELVRLIKDPPKVNKRLGEKLPPWALRREEKTWTRYQPAPWRRVEKVPNQDDVTEAMAESLDDEITKAKKEQDRLFQMALDKIISQNGSFWADGDIRIGEFIVRVEAGGRLAGDSLLKAAGEEFWNVTSAGFGRKYLYLDRGNDSEMASEEAAKTDSDALDVNHDVNIDALSQAVVANEPIKKKKRQVWKKMLKH